MLHTLAAPSHPSKTRRAVSMPALSLSFPTPGSPFLPAPSTSAPRRKSTLVGRTRLRHALPLGLAAVCALAFLCLFTGGRHPVAAGGNAARLRWYRRGFGLRNAPDDGGSYDDAVFGHPEGFEREITGATYAARLAGAGGGDGSGVHLLVADEAELIAEDDLFWESYKEAPAPTPEEAAAEQELAARRADVLARDRVHSLRALIYWMAEGGVWPAALDVPTKAALRKMGGRGFERVLEGASGAAVFEHGWADFAVGRYREVVFSKTYCPYSRNAKAILEEYRLTPTPFIIELDQRTDTAQIQTILHHLTGRRTVPNVLLDFVSVGGSDELSLLHSEGGLGRAFEEMGVMPHRGRRVNRRV